jgi:molecular chaperone DnaK
MVEGQTEVQATITQGEDTDPDYVNKIASEVFELPGDRPINQPIKVTYSYDANQRMHCRFEDEQSGKSLEVECCVGADGEMSSSNVDMKAEELEGYNVQ